MKKSLAYDDLRRMGDIWKTYEGIPPLYDKIKRMVIPNALKVLRLQKGHKYCLLGRLSLEVGWNHYNTIK
ncbi:hypothetical protein Ddye_016044, partial [Dipteronia dyeriana]